MQLESYWNDIDDRLQVLIKEDCVKLPSIRGLDLQTYYTNITKDMGDSTFAELIDSHKSLLEELGIEKYLAPKLLNIAQEIYGYEGKLSNQYHVARRVEPGNSKEMYRAHFDSHLYTVVLPINIPDIPSNRSAIGDLIYYPRIRTMPKNEVFNFFGKAYYKQFASKSGLDKLSKDKLPCFDNFLDYRPLIFIGNTTLHTNKPVSLNCSSSRLTCLAHFFDTSPKYGVGNILRYMRNR